MKPERVIILNDKKEKLVGYLYKNTSKTIVIICHGVEPVLGFPGVTDVFETYHSIGVSVFPFDFTGYGESEGKKRVSLKQRVSDIGKVIDHFSQDYDEIILYGLSFGGISVAIAANTYKKVAKIITINGFFSFNPRKMYGNQSLAIGMYLLTHPESWSEISYWLTHFRGKGISVPTLVVYGEADTDVKPIQSLSFFNRLQGRKELVGVPGGDHLLMNKEQWPLMHAIYEWLAEGVKK